MKKTTKISVSYLDFLRANNKEELTNEDKFSIVEKFRLSMEKERPLEEVKGFFLFPELSEEDQKKFDERDFIIDSKLLNDDKDHSVLVIELTLQI